MGKFLKENWLWILAPIVLVLGLFVAVMIYSNVQGGGEDTDQPFVYNIW